VLRIVLSFAQADDIITENVEFLSKRVSQTLPLSSVTSHAIAIQLEAPVSLRSHAKVESRTAQTPETCP
jgi:hypothetical protein